MEAVHDGFAIVLTKTTPSTDPAVEASTFGVRPDPVPGELAGRIHIALWSRSRRDARLTEVQFTDSVEIGSTWLGPVIAVPDGDGVLAQPDDARSAGIDLRLHALGQSPSMIEIDRAPTSTTRQAPLPATPPGAVASLRGATSWGGGSVDGLVSCQVRSNHGRQALGGTG